MVELILKGGTVSLQSKDFLRLQLVSVKRNFSVLNLFFSASNGEKLA